MPSTFLFLALVAGLVALTKSQDDFSDFFLDLKEAKPYLFGLLQGDALEQTWTTWGPYNTPLPPTMKDIH
ncbi:hypothetical protein FSP39_025161 [Pinctada imbricata]|uniref:Uncharacterized protein n=1 Tax=Pinctada imbricata TaxID=66713 RepID=A0AA89C9F3_PINIB|nr:hypothetical protein FSP39_025161 [Pinctada imbricata]